MSVFDELHNEDVEKVFTGRSKKRAGTIIKGNRVRCKTSKTINPYHSATIPNGKGKITPLLDGENLIGIIYECTCGEISKVLFEFDEDAR